MEICARSAAKLCPQAHHIASRKAALLPTATPRLPPRDIVQRRQQWRRQHTRSAAFSSVPLPASAHRRTILLASASLGAVGLATMSSKLIPSNPSEVMVIRNITPNVVTLSVPFSRFGVVAIGGRATIVRLTSGTLAVFSPVALTPEVKAKVAEMGGKLQYIVATDFEHHIFISEWAKEYPGAHIIGPEGLPEKRTKAKDPKIGQEPFFAVFTAEAKRAGAIKVTPEFDADFAYEYVDAHPNKELVFLYKPEKILIEADLLFNLPATEQYSKVPEAAKGGIASRLFASMNSTQGEATGTKRFLWHILSARDRPGFNESVRRIDEWEFQTIIPCHGDTIEGNGKEVFSKVFEWHLKGTKKG